MTDHSEDIGFLKAKAEVMENHTATLFQKSDDVLAAINKTHTLLESHIAQSTGQYETLTEEVDEIKEDVTYCKEGTGEFYTMRKAVMWVGGAIAFIWTGIWKFIDKMFLS